MDNQTKGVTIKYDPEAPKPYKVNDINDKLGRDTSHCGSKTAAFKAAERMLGNIK